MSPSTSRAVLRAIVFAGITVALVPIYLLLMAAGRRLEAGIARFWFRFVCRLFGLRVTARGTPADGRVLFVGNHVSYLDIPVLASLVDAVFVAKAEVAGWPLFGFLARIARTVFIRRAAAEAGRQRDELARRIRGDNLILFPEGTSGDGFSVLPFKSALFAVVKNGPEAAGIVVQPMTIAYVRGRDGAPLAGGRQDWYAWHGDMELTPHLRRMLTLPGADVVVAFHAPLDPAAFASRKDLARACEAAVSRGLADIRAGASPAVAGAAAD